MLACVSIVETLKKVVDPLAARNREEELKKDREQPERDDAGGPKPAHACRVCGYEGSDPVFCPECLAGTMRPARR